MFTKKGIARIDQVIGKFDQVREDLMAGVAEVDSERESNEQEIVALQTRNGVLAEAKVKAMKVVAKIDALFE